LKLVLGIDAGATMADAVVCTADATEAARLDLELEEPFTVVRSGGVHRAGLPALDRLARVDAAVRERLVREAAR
jgi:N-methylhydantoinase A/oxoprolinase/acetone carboxylase beta subunit